MFPSRVLVVATALLVWESGGGAVTAKNAEAAYLAARDAAVAKVAARDAKTRPISDADTNAEIQALTRLEAILRPIVGSVRVSGFSESGKTNLSALSKGDVGFGSLDAMHFEGNDRKSNLYVTTQGLLTNWLKAHRIWWKDKAPMPQAPTEALLDEDFYTQAISAEAAVILYTPLPTSKPTSVDFAVAHLQSETQSEPPPLPDEILVAVLRNGRLIIVQVPLATPFASIARCEALRADYAKRMERLAKTMNRADQLKKARAGAEDPVFTLTNEEAAASSRCFRDNAARQPAFEQARKQAQALLDQLAKP